MIEVILYHYDKLRSWLSYDTEKLFISTTLGANFLVVNADDFDNFLVDNHKVVLLTTHLKTFRQPSVLCAYPSTLTIRAKTTYNHNHVTGILLNAFPLCYNHLQS